MVLEDRVYAFDNRRVYEDVKDVQRCLSISGRRGNEVSEERGDWGESLSADLLTPSNP